MRDSVIVEAPHEAIYPIPIILDATPKGKLWCFWDGSIERHWGYTYGFGAPKVGRKITGLELTAHSFIRR
jgi:hypothetical protein